MSLLYILVAYEENILCEYSEYKGSFTSVSINFLSKVEKDSMATSNYNNEILISYLNSNDITFLTISQSDCDENNMKEFLKTLKNIFFTEFSNKDDFIEKNKDNHFQNTLKEKIKEFNDKIPFNSDSVLDDLKESIMKQRDVVIDTEKLLNERNEKFNNINEKTESLLNYAVTYRKKTKKIKNKVKCNKCCITLSGIIIILIILYGLSIYICKGFKFDQCLKK